VVVIEEERVGQRGRGGDCKGRGGYVRIYDGCDEYVVLNSAMVKVLSSWSGIHIVVAK
jgi:hypothetical protein